MRKQQGDITRSRVTQTVAALLAVSLLLFVTCLTVDTHAHEAFHPDADLPEHECIVTLLAHGHLTPLSVPVVLANVPEPLWVATILCPLSGLSAPDHSLPPSCGPPVAL